jgi:hypothetical protein
VKIHYVSQLLCNNDGSVLLKLYACLLPTYGGSALATKIDMRVNTSHEIERMDVPQPLQIDKISEKSWNVHGNINIINDLKFVINTKSQHPNRAFLEFDKEGKTCAAIVTCLLNKETSSLPQRKEIIFVVDRSGSMYVTSCNVSTILKGRKTYAISKGSSSNFLEKFAS